MDDEHCDICKKELDYNYSGCVKMRMNKSNSTILYFLCSNCYDCVEEFIQESKNIGVENE